MGMCALELGAGRITKEESIDPAAGITLNVKIGNRIKKGEVLATIYSNRINKIEPVSNKILNSFTYSLKKVRPPKLIKSIIK